jgi:hypothetical protein
MFRRLAIPSALVALVSVPAHLIGQQLRHGEGPGWILLVLTAAVVLIAGAILQQSEAPTQRD